MIPIESKVAWAKRCAQEYGKRLEADVEIHELLSRLQEAIRCTRSRMVAAGVMEACRKCEEEEGGSCCGAGIENRYDAVMLLINELLGTRLPELGSLPGSCFFLGKEGCVLDARHVLCVNYLCEQAVRQCDPDRLKVLREVEGEELVVIQTLHDRVKKVLATL